MDQKNQFTELNKAAVKLALNSAIEMITYHKGSDIAVNRMQSEKHLDKTEISRHRDFLLLNTM